MEERPFQPSAYGFRSIKAKTRYERRSMKDKVMLEKNRLQQRSGFAARVHRANAPEHSSMLTSCVQGGAGYLSNADRFHTDTAGEEKAIRMRMHQRKLEVAEARRRQAAERDKERWELMEKQQREEDEHWQKVRDSGAMAQKNKSNVAYDILTTQYNQDTDGEHQKYVDDMIRYRAQLRTNMLVVKGDTRVDYNIISGDQRSPLSKPEKVQKPGGQMSSRVDRRTSLAPNYNY